MDFAQIFSHRVEHQHRAAWYFSYLRWNYTFRLSLNMSRTMYSYQYHGDSAQPLKGADIAKGAVEICQALRRNYVSPDGQSRPVAGDLSKVPYVQGLSAPAGKLIQNVLHMTQSMAGTMGVRRRMRSVSKSMQVSYGLPLFVTISPDEKHNGCMLRLARTRKSDPARKHSLSLQQCGDRGVPALIAGEEAEVIIPGFEVRREVLAQNPSAAAMGFEVQYVLLMRGIFGIRVCLLCPHEASCSEEHFLCQDLLGNSSMLEGGAAGRCPASCFSKETQKQGAEHAHGHIPLDSWLS